MEKTLIEEPSIELLELFDKVSDEARKEKNAAPPINRMIYWWTRKPLIVGSAIILTSTLKNIQDVELLLGFSSDKRAFNFSPSTQLYKNSLGENPSKIKVLDPFGGSGNLIFPASYLGLDVTCSDYNALAYVIEKALLEYPPKYKKSLLQDFKKYSDLLIQTTENEVGQFFKLGQLTYLWSWCIRCPHCKQRFPLTNHMWIAKTPKKKIGIKLTPKNKDFVVDIVNNISESQGKQYTQKGGKAICISCRNSIDYNTMVDDISKNKDREMIAIQIQKIKGRDYILPSLEDKEIYAKACDYFKSKKKEFEKLNLIPNENIHHDPRSPLKNYNIQFWNEFFDDRQLLVLVILLKNIKKICQGIKDEEYRGIIATYLSFILAKRVDMAGFGVQWNTTGEKPQHVLAMRQPRVAYNFAENNPFEKIAGSIPNIVKNILDGISYAVRLPHPQKCKLESVTSSSETKYDLILTDPPYGDDVTYGELSEFFYVWVYRAIKDYFPELPNRIPLDEDFCISNGRFNNKKIAQEFFFKGLKKSFVSMNNKLKDDGLLVVFFAHSSTAAWDMLLQSLNEAKFKVVSSYSIHTENASNVLAMGKTSFLSSIVVTCRKINKESTAYFEDLSPKIEDKIKEMLSKISNEKLLTISITDLLIMVYGKVLETCTQFTELKSYEKDFKPNFENLIKDSQSFIMKVIITKLTDRSLNTLGSLTAFYLIIKMFYRGMMSADNGLKIARAYGMDFDVLEKNNVAKNEGATIKLFYLHENELDLKPEEIDENNLHQQLCYLVQVSKNQGVSKINYVLSDKRFRIDDLKQIISLLIKNFRLLINKNEKLNDDEKEELQILESISDVMGIKTTIKTKGGLDQYFEN